MKLLRRPGPRLLVEMAAIVAVAVLAGFPDVGALWIALSVFAVWLLSVFVERCRCQDMRLPVEFDELVPESFGDLLTAAAL